MAKVSQTRLEQCRAELRKILQPGDTVYTISRHVSRSGMSRVISLTVAHDGHMHNLDCYAAPLLEGYDTRHCGCKAGGCGMDMGFHLVYNLASQLWPDGFDCLGDHCPSNDHSHGDVDCTSHRHRDGGYALKQRWL